jgi:hypothetical protein
MAQAMHCRPSNLMGIKDPLTAFYADRATFSFAKTIENEMDAAVTRLPKNSKEAAQQRARQKVLDQYLGYETVSQPSRFRAPSSSR